MADCVATLYSLELVMVVRGSAMPQPVNLLTLQFLAWVESRPRSYGEARQAWRSTCPTTCAWEDAISDGLIRFETGDGRLTERSRVLLSPRGRATLEAAHGAGSSATPSLAAR